MWKTIWHTTHDPVCWRSRRKLGPIWKPIFTLIPAACSAALSGKDRERTLGFYGGCWHSGQLHAFPQDKLSHYRTEVKSNPAAQGREWDRGWVPGSGGLEDAHSGAILFAQTVCWPPSGSGGLYSHAKGQLRFNTIALPCSPRTKWDSRTGARRKSRTQGMYLCNISCRSCPFPSAAFMDRLLLTCGAGGCCSTKKSTLISRHHEIKMLHSPHRQWVPLYDTTVVGHPAKRSARKVISSAQSC